MKSLKPSHRERKRYLLIKGKDADKEKIDEVILEFMGVLGYAEASPVIINQEKNQVVLAVNTKSLNKIRASFMMNNKDLKIVKVSGTLKGLGNNHKL
jgi:RNase P/RNase MRP subunit POP5